MKRRVLYLVSFMFVLALALVPQTRVSASTPTSDPVSGACVPHGDVTQTTAPPRERDYTYTSPGRAIGAEAYSGPTSVSHSTTDAQGQCTNVDGGDPTIAGDPDHSSFYRHEHRVTGVTRRWDGIYTYDTGRGCQGPCTLSATETQRWSHKWGVSIAFDINVIKAAVGYDVTYSEARSFSYHFDVPAGTTKVVKFDDWYHITDLSVRTDWLKYDIAKRGWVVSWSQNGTAWGGQWFRRIFKAVPI